MKQKVSWVVMVGKEPTAVFQSFKKAQEWMKATSMRIPTCVKVRVRIIEVEIVSQSTQNEDKQTLVRCLFEKEYANDCSN